MLPAAGCGDVRTVGRCWGCRAGGGGGRDGAGRGVRSQMPAAQVGASAVSSLARAAVLVGLKPASQVGIANSAGEGAACGLWARPVGAACGRGLWAWPVSRVCIFPSSPRPASSSSSSSSSLCCLPSPFANAWHVFSLKSPARLLVS